MSRINLFIRLSREQELCYFKRLKTGLWLITVLTVCLQNSLLMTLKTFLILPFMHYEILAAAF